MEPPVNNEKEGEEIMAENGFSTNDAVLWGAMNNMGRGGNNGGSWGNGGGDYGMAGHGYGTFAGHSTIQHGIDNLGETVRSEARCGRNESGQAIDNFRNLLEGADRARQFEAITKQQVDSEFRTVDRLNGIERESAANARVSATAAHHAELEAFKCCCDTQKLVISENSRTREEFQRSLLDEARSRLNVSDTVGPLMTAMANQTAIILAALQNGHHHP